MPNQFWVHKNHYLVLEALKLLAAEGKQAAIVATGKQVDPRQPGHVAALMADIQSSGMSAHFIAPGLLPYSDLAPLMQASIALLNPSVFGGWSTTVEETCSAGVSMLLSDLPVHREQAGDQATYFDPRSPRELTDALVHFKPLCCSNDRFDERQQPSKLQSARPVSQQSSSTWSISS